MIFSRLILSYASHAYSHDSRPFSTVVGHRTSVLWKSQFSCVLIFGRKKFGSVWLMAFFFFEGRIAPPKELDNLSPVCVIYLFFFSLRNNCFHYSLFFTACPLVLVPVLFVGYWCCWWCSKYNGLLPEPLRYHASCSSGGDLITRWLRAVCA